MGSLAKLAIEEADEIVSGLLDTSIMAARVSIAKRRKEAPWKYVYCSRRAAYARWEIGRKYWQRCARKWRAMAEANAAHPDLCCLADLAMIGRGLPA